MSFVQLLRAETASDHELVDARFGVFVLGDTDGYRRFLSAHARALPAVEAVLADASALPAWRRRTGALAADLTALGVDMPPRLSFVAADDAARWGALYVIEGSRLGGTLLARSVPAGMPVAYLSARHLGGEWRAFLAALDGRAAAADSHWRAAALEGAKSTFALYAQAAAVEASDH